MDFSQIKKEYFRQIGLPLLGTALAQLVIVYFAIPLVEMGDMQMFKIWSHQAHALGIHQAFSSPDFNYDWLPLYLYVSKVVGAFYDFSGLQRLFGPWSSALTAVLKATMVVCHICTAFIMYVFCLDLGKSQRQARVVCVVYAWLPGLIVATHVYGYQDAFHTVLVVAACVGLIRGNKYVVCCLMALILLTKPQAVIYLLPFAWWGILQYGWRWVSRGFFYGVCTLVIALMPFWWYGTMQSVLDMYLGVTNVHEWLTGCAHNFWWLLFPVPPFTSDRMPLVLGMSGIQMGLLAFGGFTIAICWQMLHQRTPWMLLETCGLLGFGFFMLVTEIHENHHYAMFVFLVPLAFEDVWAKLRLYILTGTFAVNLFITNCWLETGEVFRFGDVRLDSVNALVNGLVFFFWCYDFFAKKRGYEQT